MAARWYTQCPACGRPVKRNLVARLCLWCRRRRDG